MARVLVLAYYFPPRGGGGVQRTLKFVQHLPATGFHCVVVTGPEQSRTTWTPRDDALAGLVPLSTEVHRVATAEPARSTGWRARTERWFRRGTPFARWWAEGVVETGRSAGADCDLIYASMSPFETAVAAARLSAELGKPWVADLRDPWALDEVLVYPTALHRRLEQRRMRQMLASADAIVMNTPEATHQLLRHFPELASSPVMTVENGFDAADFAGPAPRREDAAFRIVHAGFVHASRGTGRLERLRRLLGGSVRGFDITARSHIYLFDAVALLLERRPELAGVVEIHLAGLLSEADRAYAHAGVVREHGYLPHPEAVDLLRSADLLFLPMQNLPVGRRARVVPGKTYEYLAARRPILAAVPDGDIRDLLERAGNASVCRPTDVETMAWMLSEHIDRFLAGRPAPAPREDFLREHGQTRKYLHELEGWTARLDTIQAIVLLRKLPLLDRWNGERRAVATKYAERLVGIGNLRLPPVPEGSEPVWHIYAVRTADPEALAGFLRERGIGSGRHYPDPVHLSPAYAWLGHGRGDYPIAEAIASEQLSLPMFPGMTEAQVDAVVTGIGDYFARGR